MTKLKQIAMLSVVCGVMMWVGVAKAETSLPDFMVNDVRVADDGGLLYLKIKINNIGAPTLNGVIVGVKVEDLDTGDVYTSGYSGSLSTSSIEILSTKPLVRKSPANYRLKVTVDNGNNNDESNEANNTLERLVSFDAPWDIPDLIINDVVVAEDGGQVYAKFKISNNGVAIKDGQIISVKAEDLDTGAVYTSGYAKGLSGEIEILASNPLAKKIPADYRLKATIDYAGVITESNENNNTLDRLLSFNAPWVESNLVIRNFSYYPSKNDQNVTTQIEFYVVNNGASDAEFNLAVWNDTINSSLRSEKLTVGVGQSLHVYLMDVNNINRLTLGDNSINIKIVSPDSRTVYSEEKFLVVRKAVDELGDINTNATRLHNNQLDEILAELKQLRNKVKEQEIQIKYLKSLKVGIKGLSTDEEGAITNFITYGVDANTQKLGASERAAVVFSYKKAFDKLPETEAEMTDVIKIANGSMPTIVSKSAEKQAKEQFVKIYGRIPDMSNEADKIAIKIIAYGVKQKAKNRNLNSEKVAMKLYKQSFKANPKETLDWNTVQGIAYSGAKRKPDTDKDLVSDEMEKKLGTDQNSADSDDDGVADGREVLAGTDPLK